MIPLFFGTSGKRLFGAYDPPSGPDRRHGAGLANPLGQEYLRSHQALRHQAKLPADRGWHVLRFDYFWPRRLNGRCD